jgi:hypothetical protein
MRRLPPEEGHKPDDKIASVNHRMNHPSIALRNRPSDPPKSLSAALATIGMMIYSSNGRRSPIAQW